MHKQLHRNTALILLFSLVFFAFIGYTQHPAETVSVFSPSTISPILIIDAGHGGEDGGAVSASGVYESQINLAIAKKLDGLMAFCGIETLLLRDDDISLHDDDANTLREKKSSDLHNRLETINSYEDAVLISIHQNSYPGASSHGAQVFYADNDSGMQFAVYTQGLLVKYLDPFNHRLAAEISDSVYLMNHITCPVILVECGFLSNPEEAEMLANDSYQTKLAIVLGASYLTRDAAFISDM